MAAYKNKMYSDKYRNAELGKIHIAKKQLCLDDDAYRLVLLREGGKSSSKDLDSVGRAKVLEYFKYHGFVEANPKAGKKPNNVDVKPQLQKIEALLSELGKPWDYALSMAKHMYKKDKLEFCSSVQMLGIIAALSKKIEKDKING